MKKILLLEDEKSLAETLILQLRRSDYAVQWASGVVEAKKLVESQLFDLLILDVNLPDGNGFEFAKEVRDLKIGVPFVFMTALNDAENRLQGYELGAEEYIPKPFHLKELLLRIKHVLENHSALRKIEFSGITVNFDEMKITPNLNQVELTAREFFLFKYLVKISPQIASRSDLLDISVGAHKFPTERTIDNAIVKIRQAIGDVDATYIKTIRSVGYQWVGKKKGEKSEIIKK